MKGFRMKIGFFHDSQMVIDEGKFFSRTLHSEIWDRYLSVFDEISVSTRASNGERGDMGLSESPGVSFNPIYSYSGPAALIRRFPSMVREIQAALEQVDCAIIRLPSIIGWIAAAIAYKKKIPTLIEVVGCPWDAYRFHSAAGKILAPFGYLATRLALSRSKYALYVTQNFLQNRYPTPGEQQGVSDVNIVIIEDRLATRLARISAMTKPMGEVNFTSKPIVMGSIGRVDLSYKGHITAVRALAEVIEQGINLKYEIVGPGDQNAILEEVNKLGLQDYVTLMGAFSKAEVDNWLGSIDLYVQPSLTEGLPRSVVEAMSHALPVLLSNVGGHPELVFEDFIFPAGEEKVLAQKVIKLLENDFTEAAKRNFEKSREFDQASLQDRREQFLEKFKQSVLQEENLA